MKGLRAYIDPDEWASVVIEGIKDIDEVDYDTIKVLMLHTFFSRQDARPLVLSVRFMDYSETLYSVVVFLDLVSGAEITERHFLARIMPAGRLKIKFRDAGSEIAIDYVFSEEALEKVEAIVDTYSQVRRMQPEWFAWNRNEFDRVLNNHFREKFTPDMLWRDEYKFGVLEPKEVKESTTILKVFKK